MNVNLLENARAALAEVQTIKLMIADIDGLHGNGIVCVSSKNNGHTVDTTLRAVQSLERLRKRLDSAKEQAATVYHAALEELEHVTDKELHTILFLRHMKKYSWEQIAKHFGEGYTADALKQRHSRYLRGQAKNAERHSRRMVKGGSKSLQTARRSTAAPLRVKNRVFK